MEAAVWARSIATGGDVGGSLQEWCRDSGISRSTFDRQRVKAYERIAVAINRAGEDALLSLEALRATTPELSVRIDRLA